MAVAILSDSPTLTTGFGRTTSHIADALASSGHTVWCFGIKARPRDVGRSPRQSYRIWAANRGGHWTETLPQFFVQVKPNVLILNMDAYNAVECLDVCRAAGWTGPTVSYVCFDGLPVQRRYIDAQRSCAAVWATSPVGADYLRAAGVEVAGVAPPGVDRTHFRPNPFPDALRTGVGLATSTVVGVFATNTKRKQVARPVAGFALAAARLPHLDLVLYLHCRPRGHSRLDKLSTAWGIDDRTLFAGQDYQEHLGPPTRGGDAGPNGSIERLGYVERINLCHVLVNVPYNGDVEQIILEGQACGVPVLNTDDDGIMADALAGAGVALPADEVCTGPIGQRLHYVSPRRIADALVELLTDRMRWKALRTAGLANAARFGWDVLERAARAMVAPYDSPERN